MYSFATSLLLGDMFDPLRIQIRESVVNWLTPVWMLCVGALAGLVLCAAIWGVLRVISLIPGIGTLAETKQPKFIAIGLLTIAIFVAAIYLVPDLTKGGDAAAVAAAVEGGEAEAPAIRPLERILPLAATLVVSWLLGTAAVTLVSRAALDETAIAIREGVLWPLTITAIVMSVMALLGLFIVRQPTRFLESIARAPTMARQGTVSTTFDLPAPPNELDEPVEVPLDVNFRRGEIREIVVQADQRIKLRTEPFDKESAVAVTIDAPAGEERSWRRILAGTNPFREEVVTQFYAKNLGTGPAEVVVTTRSEVEFPQMLIVPQVACAMAFIFLTYLFQRAAVPKLSAIALSTAKSEIAQPLYAIMLAIGICSIILFIYIPYFTFASDIKMLKDSGLSLILVLSIMQAVWAASTSVADEVDGKTALTVLSKPVSRRDFILGKFAGIGWSVGLLIVVLGLVLMVAVAYKPIYDGREGGYTLTAEQLSQFQSDPTWQNCYTEMVQIVPGLVLVFLEMLVMAAISVAISTRLPFLANVIISFSIYVLGHLTPLLVQSQVVAEQLPPVVFFGRLVATVLPVLEHFNIQASIATGIAVPLQYLAWATVYCALYSAVAMLVALTLFEDRDLA
jgi:hypothetical protein